MSILSQIRNGKPKRHNIDHRAIIEPLVAALSAVEHALDEGIKVEEERSGVRDPTDPRYSNLARGMRARTDNLKITITMLEAERSAV
jgi:hypothetical protein